MGVERVPSALGFLEVKGAADGVAAVDTAVKAALVEVLKPRWSVPESSPCCWPAKLLQLRQPLPPPRKK